MKIVSRRVLATTLTTAAPLVLSAILGCGGNNTSLPGTVIIALPDGTETEVTLGSGVLSLANTTWQFFSTGPAAPAAPFVTVVFGPDGQLVRFEDNTFSPEVFGSTILFDGNRHDTSQPGLTYAAGTYGAETSDAAGFSFVGQLNAFFAGVEVATATATATGALDPNDPTVMTGTFEFTTTIEVETPGLPAGNETDSLNFRATRIDN